MNFTSFLSSTKKQNRERLSPFKGGYLDFSHLPELKNIHITEIYMKKRIQIINN